MGLFKTREERLGDEELAARSASEDLYDERGSMSIVPYLDPRAGGVTTKPDLEKNPLAFGPVWKLATRIGALPIKVYSISKDGVRSERGDHPAYTLLRRPNPVLTRNLMVAQVVTDLLWHGRAGWLKAREGDTPPVELWPIPGHALGFDGDKKNLIRRFTIATTAGKKPVRVEDVCYFRLLPDPKNLAEGVSPFGPLTTIANLGQSAIDAGTDMFDHALLGRLSAMVKGSLSTRAFNRLRRQLEAIRRSKYSIPLLEEGLELKDHQGPSDEVVINAVSMATEVIRDALGLPKDGNSRAFWEDAVQPIADAIEQEIERTLMTEWPDQPAFPEFAFRDKLRGDPLQRAQLHQTRILSGQETPDEARRDENLPPLPDGAGDQAFVPLNLVPISQSEETGETGKPEPKDSSGGLGGNEGKGTLAAASAVSGDLAMRARAKSNWGTLRDKIIRRNTDALARRLRSVINKEAKAVKAAIGGDARQARAEEPLPSIAELKRIIARSDSDVAEVLERFMRQTADTSGPGAAELVDGEFTDEVLDRLQEVYTERAAAVTERFAGVRGDRVIGLVEDAVSKGTAMRELASQISTAYEKLGTNYADGLARTEVAFAHEQAALVTWADAGIRQMEVVFGGGECTTGVCEDVAKGGPYRLGESLDTVGASFEGSDAPPLHPGCTCFSVPYVEEAS